MKSKSHKQQVEDFKSWLERTISGGEADAKKYQASATYHLDSMMATLIGMQRAMYALTPGDSTIRRLLEDLFETYWKRGQETRDRVYQEVEQAKNGAAA